MEEYRKQGAEALKIFYASFSAKLPNIAALEQGFSTNIADFRFYAKIDRIDKVDGGIRLLDYKTGKVPKEASGGHLPPAIRRQLTLYQAVLSQVPEWKDKPVVELSYQYLLANEQFSFTATPEDVAKVVEWATGVVAKIRASLSVPISDVHGCGLDSCQICRQFGEG
jgi:hypothetical protein